MYYSHRHYNQRIVAKNPFHTRPLLYFEKKRKNTFVIITNERKKIFRQKPTYILLHTVIHMNMCCCSDPALSSFILFI
jgi:hypothetical protein